MTPDLEKELTKLEKEFINKGEDDYVRDLRGGSFDDLNSKLNELAKHREAITDTQKKDAELKAAKEKVSGLEAPYKEQKKWNNKRARLVYLILSEEYPDQMEAYGQGE